MSVKPAPCPFCKGPGSLIQGHDPTALRGSQTTPAFLAYVWCSDCGGRTQTFRGQEQEAVKENAMAAWNRRDDRVE